MVLENDVELRPAKINDVCRMDVEVLFGLKSANCQNGCNLLGAEKNRPNLPAGKFSLHKSTNRPGNLVC